MKSKIMRLDDIFASIIAVFNIATLEFWNMLIGIILGVLMIIWYVSKFIDKIKKRGNG